MKAQNWLVLAMANYQLGRHDDSRNCMATARKLIEKAQPEHSDEPVHMPPSDWLPIQVLLREAEPLIADEK